MDIGTTFLTMFAKTILYYILEVSLEIANLIFMLILFMTCLMYFLSSESNMLHSVRIKSVYSLIIMNLGLIFNSNWKKEENFS
jgi:hypothetical protein